MGTEKDIKQCKEDKAIKASSDLIKFIVSVVGFLVFMVIAAYITTIAVRPNLVESTEKAVTVIIPSAISGIIGLAGGAGIRNRKDDD